MTNKETLRQKMHHILKNVAFPSLLTYSNRVEALLYRQEFFLKGNNFGIYASINDKEINTDPIIRQLFLHKKSVFIPSWKNGKGMDMVRIRDWEDYIAIPVDKHGIRRPVDANQREKAMAQEGLDVLIVPGLAFDHHGYRLGRGQGYYDSYISTYREYSETNSVPLPTLVGFAFPEQIVSHGELPIDSHDQRLDYILVGDGSVYPVNWSDR